MQLPWDYQSGPGQRQTECDTITRISAKGLRPSVVRRPPAPESQGESPCPLPRNCSSGSPPAPRSSAASRSSATYAYRWHRSSSCSARESLRRKSWRTTRLWNRKNSATVWPTPSPSSRKRPGPRRQSRPADHRQQRPSTRPPPQPAAGPRTSPSRPQQRPEQPDSHPGRRKTACPGSARTGPGRTTNPTPAAVESK